MPDFRAYSPHATADAREIVLSPGESHHLVVVNRCSRGDPVVAFDGRGREWSCTCRDAAKSGATLAVESTRTAPPREVALTLVQALPKGSTMDEIVRQATELGAARIVPLLTERTQVQLDGDRADKKVEKWRTAAVEAAKQCGNPWVPEIAPVQDLAAVLASLAGEADELRLVASLHPGAQPLRTAVADWRAAHAGKLPSRALWLVGPEGDFSPAEMAKLRATGVVPVTLGPLVLRCDTAAVAALSVLAHEFRSAG
jgi:16S rRNA (uracil1498-N3)-methyltransferase